MGISWDWQISRTRHAHERRAVIADRHAAVGVVHVQRRKRRRGSGVRGQAAGIRSEQEISAEIFDPWRTARSMGRRVDVSLERGVVRRDGKLRGGDDQFPQLNRLRTEVYGLD